MKRNLLLVACIALAGCSTFTDRTVTEKPIPVECREKVADRPAMPTEAFTAKPTLDALVKALDAEIVLREAYEVQLRTALVICTTPIIPP